MTNYGQGTKKSMTKNQINEYNGEHKRCGGVEKFNLTENRSELCDYSH